MIVLNNRDWSEIIRLPKIFEQPCNRLYPKKPAGIHWLGYNDAVSWLNEAKTQIFQPTANFKFFEIYLYFVCQPASLPACLPAVRPSYAKCRAPEISHDKGNGSGFMKMLFRRRFTHCAMAIPFILLSLLCSSLFLWQGANLTFEGVDSLLRLLLIASHK